MLGGGRVNGDVVFCPAQTTHPVIASLDHPLFGFAGVSRLLNFLITFRYVIHH
jgi:hypothetical protein